MSDAPNRASRRATERGSRSKRIAALGSSAVLATTGAAAVTALTAAPASAAPILVNSPGDNGGGTLRAALAAATDGDVITFDPTITTITLTTGDLEIEDGVAIQGPGPGALTITAGGANQRVFDVIADAGDNVVISGLTITGGNPGGSVSGGGVYQDSGNLRLEDVVVTDNHADTGGYGGGVGSDAEGGTLTITGSVISANTASGDGGGLYVFDAPATTITDSLITGNSSNANGGGGVRVRGENDSTFSMVSSTVSDNDSHEYGGGLYLKSLADITIADSTISGNHTDQGGGGLEFFTLEGPVSIANSTISGNIADNTGGGLYGNFRDYALSILQSTIAHNTADETGGAHLNDVDATIVGTVFADNIDAGGTDTAATDLATNVPSLAADARDGGNPKNGGTGASDGVHAAQDFGATLTSSLVEGLIAPEVTLTDGGGNLRGADPLLGALAANGGPTQTQGLLPGSPAINTGPNPVPDFPGNTNDQRGPGYVRVSGGRSDIGAFEVQAIEVTPRFTG